MAHPESTPLPTSRKVVPLVHLGHPDADHIPFFELPREPSKLVPHGRLMAYAILAGAVACLGQWRGIWVLFFRG